MSQQSDELVIHSLSDVAPGDVVIGRSARTTSMLIISKNDVTDITGVELSQYSGADHVLITRFKSGFIHSMFWDIVRYLG